jgi:hypothetical protein
MASTSSHFTFFLVLYCSFYFVQRLLFDERRLWLLARFRLAPNEKYVFVSGYWEGPSKHSPNEYRVWIRRFFRIFVGRLYFYTTPQFWEWLVNETEPKPNVHYRLNYTDPFEIPSMRSRRSQYANQWVIDPEKDIHYPRLYAIWNAKITLISQVSLIYAGATVVWID